MRFGWGFLADPIFIFCKSLIKKQQPTFILYNTTRNLVLQKCYPYPMFYKIKRLNNWKHHTYWSQDMDKSRGYWLASSLPLCWLSLYWKGQRRLLGRKKSSRVSSSCELWTIIMTSVVRYAHECNNGVNVMRKPTTFNWIKACSIGGNTLIL